MIASTCRRRSRPVPSATTEADLILRAQDGDRRAVEQILAAYTNLVWLHVRRWENGARSLDADDLYSVGALALLTAIRRFDATNGAKFITFATRCVGRAIAREIGDHGALIRLPSSARQKGTALPVVLSLDGCAGSLEEDEVSLVDALPALDDTEASVVSQVSCRELLAMLPAQERAVLRGLVVEERTPGEVAEAIGIGKSKLFNLRQAALTRLRRRLGVP